MIRGRRRSERSRSGAIPGVPEVFTMAGVADAVAVDTDLMTALRALSPADREVLYLVCWEDLDHRDAAAVLNCSVTAFRVRLHRARRRLRHEVDGPASPRSEVPDDV